MTVTIVTNEYHLPHTGCAAAFVPDIPRGEHGVVMFHQFAGELIGLYVLNSGGGKQFGCRSLPAALLLQKISYLPKIRRNCFLCLLFLGFFFQKLPDAVLGLQMQRAAVHIPACYQKLGGIAHSLALKQQNGIRRPHQTIGTGNLLEGIDSSLFPQMMYK